MWVEDDSLEDEDIGRRTSLGKGTHLLHAREAFAAVADEFAGKEITDERSAEAAFKGSGETFGDPGHVKDEGPKGVAIASVEGLR